MTITKLSVHPTIIASFKLIVTNNATIKNTTDPLAIISMAGLTPLPTTTPT